MRGLCSDGDMAYEWTAICDACGTRRTFQIEAFNDKFPYRPLRPGGPTFIRGDNRGSSPPKSGWLARARASQKRAGSSSTATLASARRDRSEY